jgi:hypothetical protein
MSWAALDPLFDPTEELPLRVVIGVDLGQSKDYTTVVINRITSMWDERKRHNIQFIHRFRLGTSYPAIVRQLASFLAELPKDIPEDPILAVDMTGVGRPVVDMMRDAGLSPIGVTITGGADWSRTSSSMISVPKKLLASTMQVLLQTGRIKIAEDMPLTPILIRELEGFRVKISATGNESFEAWRQTEHDDIVLAAAIACWCGERPMTRPTVRLI